MARPQEHLRQLEAESIYILREVVAEFERPVLLYSIGKVSTVLLHLAMKAFYPGKLPFPVLHVDTTWNFREVIAFRDQMAQKLGLDLLVHVNAEGVAEGVGPLSHGSTVHTDIMKTQALRQALDEGQFDAVIGDARRDEDKSQANARVFSRRLAQHRPAPKGHPPEIWKLYNTRLATGESMRVFPLSNWTEFDVWAYIQREDIPIAPLYFAAERPIVERNGMLIMPDDERMALEHNETAQMRRVRFPTLGCYPLTGAIESDATTVEQIIAEVMSAHTSKRGRCSITDDETRSMENKKQAGRL